MAPWLLLLALFFCSPTLAQQKTPAPKPDALTGEIKKLQSQIKTLKNRIQVLSAKSQCNLPDSSDLSTGGVAILFGAFCALWAQNNRRNALLWFIGGLIFNVFAVLLLLYFNSKLARRNTR